MKSFVAAVVVFMAGIFPTIVADAGVPGLRYLRGYTQENYAGPFGEFQDYVPDLSVYSLDNAIKSICLTGYWLLYSHTNYEGTRLGSYQKIDNCENLAYKDQTSSLRYAGSPYGLNDVYYNLYAGDYFTGAEFRGNTNAETIGALDQNVSSIIITGQTPWTFFTGLQYTGLAFCLYPNLDTVGQNGIEILTGAVYFFAQFDLPAGSSIRSVAKGCLSKKILRLPPLEASIRPEVDHKLTNNAH